MRKFTLFLTLAVLVAFLNCKKDKDPCEDVFCRNGGVCNDGLCDCPPGYVGEDCSVVLTPLSITIRQMTILNFPNQAPDGSNWDSFDGPDVYLQIYDYTGSLVHQTGYFEDLAGPYTWTINKTFVYPDQVYSVRVFDYDDGITTDDLMGSISGKFWNVGDGFPTTKTLSCSGCPVSFRLDNITWN